MVVEIIYLRLRENAPQGACEVSIQPTPSGKNDVHLSVQDDRRSMIFYFDRGVEGGRQRAIERAVEWAGNHGVDKIYVEYSPDV